MSNYSNIFTQDFLRSIFPAQRADDFFEALFGGAEEGAYDIELNFTNASNNKLEFSLDLLQRPGKCLACNLTYGLPQVFSRHPIININGIVKDLLNAIDKDPNNAKWSLDNTQEISKKHHSIPLQIQL